LAAAPRQLSAEQLLFTQGFGTRRECRVLVRSGSLVIAGRVVDEPHAAFDAAGLEFVFDGVVWPYRERALLMLHKPAGYECSQKPRHHPSVMSLLPAPLRRRGVQPVGRLDEDTTGLLLFTDDGTLIHRLTSPKHHVPKVYEVLTRHAVTAAQIDALLTGVQLDDEPAPLHAAACEATGDCALRLTLTEGRYHQVKRMVAAAGNRVERLHRSAFGALVLEEGLAAGQWRWVDAAHLTAAADDHS
jgi:16S rRNA pseudouridine516 synthase